MVLRDAVSPAVAGESQPLLRKFSSCAFSGFLPSTTVHDLPNELFGLAEPRVGRLVAWGNWYVQSSIQSHGGFFPPG